MRISIIDHSCDKYQVLLTTRPSKRWALSARNTICPAALTRGADFNLSHPFPVPWHARVLRMFLPQAPGTGGDRYREMMAAVVRKIEHPYRVYVHERERLRQLHSHDGDKDVAANSGANLSVGDVLSNEVFQRETPPSSTPSASGHFTSTVVYCRGNITDMMALFDAWEAYVRSVVPADRLVVFRLGRDGWPELCAGLNVSLPVINPHLPPDSVTNPPPPFPLINTSADYYTMMLGKRMVAALILVTLGLSVVLAAVVVWRCCCRADLAGNISDWRLESLQREMRRDVDRCKED